MTALTDEQRAELQAVAEGRENGSAPEAAPTTWATLPLAAVLDGANLEPPPSMLARDDGSALLYERKIHELHGEPESGKGWAALAAATERLDAGEAVLYIDFETDAGTVVSRLLALGVGRDAIAGRFGYVRPDEPLGDQARCDVEEALNRLRPSLAIVDGLTEAYALHGLSPDSGDDAARWLAMLPRWLSARGIAVVQIDHVSKDKDSRGRWPTGSQHKLAGVDVSYSIRVLEPFGRGRSGSAAIKVVKDRPGYVRQFATDSAVAVMRMTSDEDGRVAIVFESPDRAAEAQSFRPTGFMERISKAIEESPGLSQNEIRTAVKGKNDAKMLALRLLVGEGHVEARVDADDGRRTNRHYSVRPYREDDDDRAPTEAGAVDESDLADRARPRPDRALAPGGEVSDTAPDRAYGPLRAEGEGRGSDQPIGDDDRAPEGRAR